MFGLDISMFMFDPIIPTYQNFFIFRNLWSVRCMQITHYLGNILNSNKNIIFCILALDLCTLISIPPMFFENYTLAHILEQSRHVEMVITCGYLWTGLNVYVNNL